MACYSMTKAFLLLSAIVVVTVQASNSASVAGDASSLASDVNSATTAALTNSKSIRVGPGISAAIGIALGAVVCFFGYRLLRPTMFACGFLVGALVVSTAIENMFSDASWEPTGVWIGFIVGGLLCGTMVITLYNLGIFLIGAAGGVLLAIACNTSFGYKLYPAHPSYVLITLIVIFAILGGVLARKLERPVIIVATSLVGSGVLIAGIGYFGKSFPTSTDLTQYREKDSKTGEWVYTIPSAWWAYLAAMLALFGLGMLIQFGKTGKTGKIKTVEMHTPHQKKGYMQA